MKEAIMDLSGIPVVDSHCHPFDPAKEDDDFRVYFNMSLWRPPTEIIVDTVQNRKLMRELGKFIGAPRDAGQDEIAEHRNKLYKADPKGYIQRLFKDSNVKTMLVDTGFPHEEFTGYSVDLKTFSDLVPAKVYPIFRMAPTIFRIFKDLPSSFDEAVDIMETDLEHAVKLDKIVAIKSIAAYETGLEIKKRSKKEAGEAYNRFKKEKNRKDEKIIRDYFAVMGLKEAGKNDIPIQFHTGFGSAPNLNLFEANPMLLAEILADEEIRDTKVVITHSGMPFTRETGYLCSVYPNCYCDVTAITPYAVLAFKNAVLEILEFAPANRIMFGTDGVIIPETFWLGVTQGVRALGMALDELVSSDWITASEAVEFAELILFKTAEKLYKV
jgi:predicted TIM-barrel fold metal-dependent hydrolase